MRLIKSIAGVIMIFSGGFLGVVAIIVFIRNVVKEFYAGSDTVYFTSFVTGTLLAFLFLGSIAFVLIKYGIKFLKSKPLDNDLSIDEDL